MQVLDSAAAPLSLSAHNKTLGFYASRQANLYIWACQISEVLQSPPENSELWSAAGHCLIVIEPDVDELLFFLMATAGAIEGQFLSLSIEQFIECAEDLVAETLPSVVYIEPGPWLTQKNEDREIYRTRTNVKEIIKSFYTRHSPVVIVSHADCSLPLN